MENNVTLYDVINFSKRCDALDFLDFHVIDRISALSQETELRQELDKLNERAEIIKGRLEKIDSDLFDRIRQEIKSGALQKQAFLQLINKYCAVDDSTDEEGYDELDAFINGLLLDQPLPEATAERTQEMVFYQQTPARIILELIKKAQFKATDVFYDLGSGLGHIGILVHLICGIKATGIEYEPAYCNYAKACTRALNLGNIEFVNADARNADYADGTVFFMYTPFTGSILQHVLNRLQEQSKKRAIRIFTYGPCSAIVAMQNWLQPLNGTGEDIYELYEYRSIAR
ncbi:MAG: class I SAM-dependent methyltransferase [Flavipsychrobacter sp.]